MKTLLLIRHAKSDWADPSLEDIDRPLNGRGKKDAPEMAKRLVEKKIAIEAFVSSPAKRAKSTAKKFAKVYKQDKDDIILVEELYAAPSSAFFDVVSKLKDKFDTVALFSHNPGITDFANQLTDARIDNIPTSGVFAVKVDAKSWSEFRDAKKEFLFFDYPKQSVEK
jgi:phosphohistidine phosphatase